MFQFYPTVIILHVYTEMGSFVTPAWSNHSITANHANLEHSVCT